MNVRRRIQDLLIADWTQNITGRTDTLLDVSDSLLDKGKIPIVLRKEVRQSDTSSRSFVMIEKLSRSTQSQSIGYTDEKIEEELMITAVSTTQRLNGSEVSGDRVLVGDTDDRWGGVTGEIERILKSYRAGYQEFEAVDVNQFQDVSANYGPDTFAQETTVRLVCLANDIDTST